MAERTAIAWTDSTFNPWIGCTKVGPGCDHCYAEALMDQRFGRVEWGPGKSRQRTSAANWRQPLLWEKEHQAFALMHGRRRRVFCASLADVFDNEVYPQWRTDLFELIDKTPHLDWLLLTKRIGNVAAMLEHVSTALALRETGAPWPPRPNVWLGITVVNQAEADRDIPKLLATPAAVRFLSVEPMLGPVDLTVLRRRLYDPILNASVARPLNALAGLDGQKLDWVICGGESGPSARPMHPDWACSLRDHCAVAGVPFFFKQWGEWVPMMGHAEGVPVHGPKFTHPDGTIMGRAGTKAAGCLLDGVEIKQWPVR